MFVCRVAARHLTLPVATAALLAGCASTPLGPTVQVMPGPGKTFDVFQADNANCKGFAQKQVQGQADAANQRAVGTALLATVLGALGGNAGAGAAVGSAVGAGAGTAVGASGSSVDQQTIQAQYDNAFSQCMYAQGEQVPGFAPTSVAYVPSATAAAPDPLMRATQSELIRLGYLQGSADGYAGPRTRRAISSYEQANGLAADGNTSSRLLAKLQATPTNATAATASAPSAWVAPTGSPGVTPASASAPAPSGWVAPTRSP
jgi:hypothetical protein